MMPVPLSGRLSPPRAGTKQRGMHHPTLAQRALVIPQPVKDFLRVHASAFTTVTIRNRGRKACRTFLPPAPTCYIFLLQTMIFDA